MTRAEMKERTRRAILDSALALSDAGTPLAALSLRQVAKEVGIVPTAFYRHFASIDELGLALVDESLAALREMLREIRRTADPDFRRIIDASLDTLLVHVRRHESHFKFIARERFAGPAPVREAIEQGITLFVAELATDLARLPLTDQWSAEDLRIVSDLIVGTAVITAERLVTASAGSAAENRITAQARAQLRMVVIGARNWQSRD